MTKTIYIKLTNACNLKCKHCYNEILHNHSNMSKNILEKVIIYLKSLNTNNEEIDIHLHGGEPFMYDISNIQYLLYKTKNLNFKWTITTNLIYEITKEHLDIFKQMLPFDNNPFILTSWDYKIRFKDDQQELWENNVRLLKENNINVQPIICLTNILIKEKEPEEIFKYFTDKDIYNFNFERITNTGRALDNNLRPYNIDLQNWLLKAYKLYEKNNKLKIPLFEGIKQSINGIFLGCRNRSCMNDVITINPDGTIAGCPNTCDKKYGNLDKIDTKIKENLINLEKQRSINCLTCKFFKYCNGDCFQLIFDETGCPGMKSIYSYILD